MCVTAACHLPTNWNPLLLPAWLREITPQVLGKNNTSGIALIEVYNLP